MAKSTFKVLFYLKRQAEQNGQAPIMGAYHHQRNHLAVQLQNVCPPEAVGHQNQQSHRQKRCSPTDQRKIGGYLDQRWQTVPPYLRPGFLRHGREGQECLAGIREWLSTPAVNL